MGRITGEHGEAGDENMDDDEGPSDVADVADDEPDEIGPADARGADDDEPALDKGPYDHAASDEYDDAPRLGPGAAGDADAADPDVDIDPGVDAVVANATPVHGAPAAAAAAPWRDALVLAPPRRRRRRRAIVGVGAVLIVGTGVAVLLATRAGDPASTAAPASTVNTTPTSVAQVLGTTVVPSAALATTLPATTSATTTAAQPTTTAAPPTTSPATTTSAPTTAAPAGSAAAAAQDAGIPNLYTPVRWAIYQGGRVRLLGRVPNQQVADTIAAKATAVVGPGNVSVEYVIDPTAPVPPAAPLYVRDTVQFGPDSAVVAPQFKPLLDLGVRLMQQNAGVRIWVLGRADSEGDPQANLMLSLRRSQAVMSYLAAAGIDESRLFAVPLGVDAALGDNTTPEGRQQNRSVEFVIAGLLS